MRTLHRKSANVYVCFFLPLLMSFLPLNLNDQSYSATNNVKITVEGTSNIHDWDLVSEKGTCSMTVQQDAAGILTDICGRIYLFENQSLM